MIVETLQIKILVYTAFHLFSFLCMEFLLNLFVFDIETIPDVEAGRKLYHFENLCDAEVAQGMMRLRQESHGSDFLPHYLQKIVAISAVLRTPEQFSLWSLGEETSSEAELIHRFFKGLERFTPTLVSWNGSGFDLPVIHYRALFHGIQSPTYWETQGDSKWNNYLNRYHDRHTDLMDVLSAYQLKAAAPLDAISKLCGFPGKQGMDGEKVWDQYLRKDLASIRNYCETDVLNTYLVYLRYQLLRGHLTQEAYEGECELVKKHLTLENKPHLNEFLKAWQTSSPLLT
jgi:predicted PolB exonuclease-like 3'-5' exonuclease